MKLVTLEAAKLYLRVDSADEDGVIQNLLSAAGKLCADVARLSAGQWADVDSDTEESEFYSREELGAVRDVMRVSILYALGYLYEHREEADHHALVLTLRSLLCAVREGVI